MARILHIEQKIEKFRAFERAIERYQNAESVQFYKRDRSVEKAQVCLSGVFTAARTSSLEGQS